MAITEDTWQIATVPALAVKAKQMTCSGCVETGAAKFGAWAAHIEDYLRTKHD